MTNVVRRALVGMTIGVIASAIAFPTAARAHSELVGSSPGDGVVLTQAPEQVRLQFSEPVQQQGGMVTVTGEDGQPYALPETFQVSGTDIVIDLTNQTASGLYTVAYRAVSADGHVVQGTYDFGLTLGATASRTPTNTQGASASAVIPPIGTAGLAGDDDAGSATWVLGLGAIGLALVALLIAVIVKPRATTSRQWKVLLCAVGVGLTVVVTGTIAIAATRPVSDLPDPYQSDLQPGAYLAALQSDPMASEPIPGTNELRKSESESGTNTERPDYAEVIRVLEVDSDPQSALGAAAELASGSGWTLTSQEEEEYHFERALGTVIATLTLHLDYTEDPEEHPHVVGHSLTVYLDASETGEHHKHED